MPAAPAETKKLLWSQEFNSKAGTPVSKTFWTHDIGDGTEAGSPGWGNGEREYYIQEALKHDGKGALVVNAKKMSVPANGKTSSTNPYLCYYGTACEWTSGKIHTLGKVSFMYGRIEARIKMPKGVGMWPAFWMLGTDIKSNPWPACGEIDIVEAKGHSPKLSFGTVHGPGYSGGSALSTYYSAGNTPLSAGFHTYRVDWLPNSIKFYVDGQLTGSHRKSTIAPKDWVYNAEFYLILNLATGGNFDGGELDESIEKAELKVDWIKYETLNGVGQLIKK